MDVEVARMIPMTSNTATAARHPVIKPMGDLFFFGFFGSAFAEDEASFEE